MINREPSAATHAGVNRRAFLQGAAAFTMAAASGTLSPSAEARPTLGDVTGATRLIDCNVTLGQWPCRRLPLDDARSLVRYLRQRRLAGAWAGSFEGMLYNDISASNRRLVEACRNHGRGFLMPFGTVNPQLPQWERDLDLCATELRMPGVRLYPTYHGYTLEDGVFTRVLRAANQHKLILQLPVMLEDERTQHPFLRVKHLDVRPLLKLLESHHNIRVLLLNWWRGVPRSLLPVLAKTGKVFLDTATVEGVSGLRSLLDTVPLSAVVFGSYSPFFYWESSMLKLIESELSPAELEGVSCGNAGLLLNASAK